MTMPRGPNFLVGGVVAALRYGAGDFVAVLLVLVASAYLLPTIIAAIRKHNNTAAILLLTKAASCTSGNSGRLQRTRNPAVRNATPAT